MQELDRPLEFEITARRDYVRSWQDPQFSHGFRWARNALIGDRNSLHRPAISWQFRLHAPPVALRILLRVAEIATLFYHKRSMEQFRTVGYFREPESCGGQTRERKPKPDRWLRVEKLRGDRQVHSNLGSDSDWLRRALCDEAAPAGFAERSGCKKCLKARV